MARKKKSNFNEDFANWGLFFGWILAVVGVLANTREFYSGVSLMVAVYTVGVIQATIENALENYEVKQK